MDSILLGIRRAGDRPPGVTNSQYLLGFFISIAAAAILGFILVSTQVAYAKANQGMTYTIVLQFQVCLAFFATLICTIGSLINKDFSEMQREASDFDLGAKTYYLVLASNMVVWQLMFIGRVGIIFCTSSLFAGVMSASLLPISQIAAVITFHENFTGEKGMALALALWGFTSYFYGSYRNSRRQSPKPHEATERDTQPTK
ncbi:purine permease 3-like [Papaver somniferum]|nr:purine permease 3-like [Papaver somniferum]